MEDCLFCKIIKGEIPSAKIYENENIFVFLDINPVNIGHTLIIPKEHFKNIYTTPSETICEMMSMAKKLSIAIKDGVKADGINIAMNNDEVAGQVILHAHLHVIPRFEDDGFTLWHSKRQYNEGEMAEVVEKIKAVLN